MLEIQAVTLLTGMFTGTELFGINRKIFGNSWLKRGSVTISMGNPVATWPQLDWLHCHSRMRGRRKVLHCP